MPLARTAAVGQLEGGVDGDAAVGRRGGPGDDGWRLCLLSRGHRRAGNRPQRIQDAAGEHSAFGDGARFTGLGGDIRAAGCEPENPDRKDEDGDEDFGEGESVSHCART